MRDRLNPRLMLLWLVGCLLITSAQADDAALEARVHAIASELRCLVCQNQSVADSHADLALDLQREIRSQLRQGRSEREVLDFMTERYGDFVRYRPPFNGSTALLWLAPALLLTGTVTGLLWVLRRRQRLSDAAFDPPASNGAEAN